MTTAAVKTERLTGLGLDPELERILLPRRRRTIIEWAEQEYRLPEGHAMPGLLDWSRSPYWIEPALALTDGYTQEVVVLACTQCGKTLVLGNAFLGWCVCESPGNFLDVLPRKEDFKKRMNEDIKALLSCDAIKRHLVRESSEVSKNSVLFDNMNYYLGSAATAEDLSQLRARHGKADECKTYAPGSGKLGNPIELLRDRGRSFWDFNMLVVSSPGLEGDIIENEFESGDQGEYYIRCPHCKGYHVPIWENVRLAHNKEGHLLHHELYADGRRSRYVCGDCGCEWSEDDRWEAISDGIYRPKILTEIEGEQKLINMPEDRWGQRIEIWERFRRKPQKSLDARAEALDKLSDELLANHKSTTRSFRVSSLIVNPIFTKISELAVKYARAIREARKGRVRRLQAFVNNELAESWKESQQEMTETSVEKHRADADFETVPADAIILTAGIDVQARGFYATVFAWGLDWQSWLLYADFVPSGRYKDKEFIQGDTKDPGNFKPMEAIIETTWSHAEHEKPLPIQCAGFDSSDGTRSYQIYDFINRYNNPRRVFPLKGDDAISKPPFIRLTDLNSGDMIERRRKRGRRLRYNPGQVLYRFSPLYYKSLLWQWTQAETPGPGYMQFPLNVSVTFARQFGSQYLGKDRKTGKHVWKNRKGYSANHYFDASAMAAVAAEIAGVGNLRNANRNQTPARRRLGRLKSVSDEE